MLPPSSSPNFFTTPSGMASAGLRCWNSSKRRSGAFASMAEPLPRRAPRSIDQVEHLALDPLPRPFRHRPRRGGAAAEVDRLAVAIAVEDARVDVGAAADRGGVAERGGDGLDGAVDRPLGRRGRGGLVLAGERRGGEDGAAPGAEVLGREFGPD